jgi:hypothetical protein
MMMRFSIKVCERRRRRRRRRSPRRGTRRRAQRSSHSSLSSLSLSACVYKFARALCDKNKVKNWKNVLHTRVKITKREPPRYLYICLSVFSRRLGSFNAFKGRTASSNRRRPDENALIHMNFFLSLSYLSSAALNSFTHPLYNKYGTPTPKIAITPTVLGEKRKVLSTTSRAWPWSSTNWFGFTDVGSAPAIIIISSLSARAFMCEVSLSGKNSGLDGKNLFSKSPHYRETFLDSIQKRGGLKKDLSLSLALTLSLSFTSAR